MSNLFLGVLGLKSASVLDRLNDLVMAYEVVPIMVIRPVHVFRFMK